MSNKKNMLGMDLTEWKHLSGLADPYALALAEAGVQAGVPKVVIKEDDDDGAGVPKEFEKAQSAQGKKVRRDQIARAARNLSAKTRNAAAKVATTPAKDRYKAHLELMKHRKTFVKAEDIENFDHDILWAVYLESIGTSAEEFGNLLDVAIMNEDEEMTIELLSVEDQLDEIFGAIAGGLAKGAQMVGRGALAAGKVVGQGALDAAKMIGKGAVGAAKGVAGAAGDVVGSAAKGVAKGFSGGAAAGGGQPAGAPPPGGAFAAPAGASAPATAAAPAGAADAAKAPAPGGSAGAAPASSAGPQMTKKQPGLLGTLARGIGKVARGVGGMGASVVKGAGQLGQNVAAGYRGEDVEAWEEYLGEEFGISAERYIEMCDEAYAAEDVDMIESLQQLDEIFAAWRAKKQAAETEKRQKVADGYKAARDVVAKHGANAVKAASVRGKAIGAPPAGSGTSVHAKKAESIEDAAMQIMESSGAFAPREHVSSMKALISSQLQYSGYSDEYIEGRSKAQQYHGMMAQHPDKGIRKIASTSAGKEQAAGLVSKAKDRKNQLAPQLVKAFRADNKMGKAVRK